MITAVLVGLCLLAPAAAYAAETGNEDDSPAVDQTLVDRSYDSMDSLVQNAIRRVDSFFVDEEHATFADTTSRIRLRLNTDHIEHHGWDTAAKVKLNLALPGISERLRLVMNDEPGPDVDQATADEDENDLALRWIGKQSDTQGYSFDLGVHMKNGSLDPFGRINLGLEYALPGRWVGQSTNRIYYYAKTGFRNDFRQYFNRALTDSLLFRSRTRIQYFEENEQNPYIEQKFSLFHSLSDTRKLAYEALYRKLSIEDSPFDADEIQDTDAEYFNHYQLQVRYRQQLWKPWFYVEFWPIVNWPQERDYATTLGARLRLEVNLGGSGDQRLDE